MGIMTFRRALCLAIVVLGTSVFVTTKLAAPEGAEHDSPAVAAPHDIPADVTVRVFVRPVDTQLHMLIRVPLEAMRDVDFPQYGRGYLDLDAAGPFLRDAAQLWLADYVEVFEEDRRLAVPEIRQVRVSLPSDRSFRSYETAEAHFTDPGLDPNLDLPWRQALLDVWLVYDIESEESRFSMNPGFAHLGLRTVSVLRLLAPDRPERVFQYLGDPGLVRLDPRWHQAVLRFAILGFEHILDGIDHILFLLCLLIPLRRIWAVVPVVTSFTVAHSITLIASAFGFAPRALWFPALIETLIALSIVFMAVENIIGHRPRRRWAVAFGFGLAHGFGFSFVLAETLQFAGSHLVASLLAFNVGVEIGQLVIVVIAMPLLGWIFRVWDVGRVGTIILSVLIGHTGWHWMTDRGSELLAYDFSWPPTSGELWSTVTRWGLLLLLVLGMGFALERGFRYLSSRRQGSQE